MDSDTDFSGSNCSDSPIAYFEEFDLPGASHVWGRYGETKPGPSNPPQIDSRLIAVCARNNYQLITVEIYNARERRWMLFASRTLPISLRHYHCVYLNKYIYFISVRGDLQSNQHQMIFMDIQLKNLYYGRRLNIPRTFHSVVVLGDHIYCIGGLDAHNVALRSVERWSNLV